MFSTSFIIHQKNSVSLWTMTHFTKSYIDQKIYTTLTKTNHQGSKWLKMQPKKQFQFIDWMRLEIKHLQQKTKNAIMTTVLVKESFRMTTRTFWLDTSSKTTF